MADIVSSQTRSRMMSGIRGKDTKPEMLVRQLLHGRGFRYRLHVRALSGSPDLVFPSLKAVVFVHGCFWHGHEGCSFFRWPKSRQEFWKKKIGRNRSNDSVSIQSLSKDGWRVLVVWECALRGKNGAEQEKVADMIADWLNNGKRNKQIKDSS